jgi:hypothetical protein
MLQKYKESPDKIVTFLLSFFPHTNRIKSIICPLLVLYLSALKADKYLTIIEQQGSLVAFHFIFLLLYNIFLKSSLNRFVL